MIEKKQSWAQSILVYKDIRMLRILLLGAISGFPWVLIASSLSLWLKEEGIDPRKRHVAYSCVENPQLQPTILAARLVRLCRQVPSANV